MKVPGGRSSLVNNRQAIAWSGVAAMVLITITAGIAIKLHSHASSAVPGQSYLICDNPGQFLTSPYSYHALGSGSQSYTVAQYEAQTGYGSTLPALPAYISGQDPSAEAAVIFAPGTSDISQWWGAFPQTPLLYFFEGGAYTGLNLASVSGDEFIGGSATGFPEPTFDDSSLTDNGGGGIGDGSGYGYSGGTTTLSQAASNTAQVTTTDSLPQWLSYVTFADGVTKQISTYSGASITLDSPVTEPAGTQVWYSGTAPIAYVSTSATKGATSVTLGSSTSPVIPWGNYVIGTDNYQLPSTSGSQSAYTLNMSTGGLDTAVAAHTPVYYNDYAGGVSVSYLNIANDIHHGLSGVITTGAGWTVTHNNIHDSYTAATAGTASGAGIFGGDESTIEYNCLSKTGNNAMAGWFGSNAKWDYNEIYQSAIQDDPDCGCTAAAKWWGTLNTDIVGNAFIDDGVGSTEAGDDGDIWLDNGNTGTNISDNYFDKAVSNAISAETGFNLNITNNLFQDGGWGTGDGCENTNCAGAIDLDSSGGANVPLSRYNNQVNISGNQFINNWGGVDIWESNLRNCESSGEGWPVDAAYCSGGYPTTTMAAAGGQYYFSHVTDTDRGGTGVIAQTAASGSTTVVLKGDREEQPAAEAINDQIGFAKPRHHDHRQHQRCESLGLRHHCRRNHSGFPTSGQLRVGTSAAGSDGGGGFTGAVLTYTGKTANHLPAFRLSCGLR